MSAYGTRRNCLESGRPAVAPVWRDRAGALPLLGWLFSGKPWPAEMTREQGLVIGALAMLGVAAAALAVIRPQTLRWPFVGATLLAFPLAWSWARSCWESFILAFSCR